MTSLGARTPLALIVACSLVVGMTVGAAVERPGGFALWGALLVAELVAGGWLLTRLTMTARLGRQHLHSTTAIGKHRTRLADITGDRPALVPRFHVIEVGSTRRIVLWRTRGTDDFLRALDRKREGARPSRSPARYDF